MGQRNKVAEISTVPFRLTRIMPKFERRHENLFGPRFACTDEEEAALYDNFWSVWMGSVMAEMLTIDQVLHFYGYHGCDCVVLGSLPPQF